MTRKIKERLNIYMCEHGCHNVTVDIARGVTPFMMKCKREGDKKRPLDPRKSKNGVCIGTAQSCMYPKELVPGSHYPIPKHEWYRPTLEEFNKLDDSVKEHVEKGGLLLRKRTEATPVLHKDEWSYEDEDFQKEIAVFKQNEAKNAGV